VGGLSGSKEPRPESVLKHEVSAKEAGGPLRRLRGRRLPWGASNWSTRTGAEGGRTVTQLDTVVGTAVAPNKVAHLTGVVVERPSHADLGVRLLVPENDVEAPLVSIVVPAKDEALTMRDFVTWSQLGLQRSGTTCELLAIRSPSDGTATMNV